jgi:sialidase-1
MSFGRIVVAMMLALAFFEAGALLMAQHPAIWWSILEAKEVSSMQQSRIFVSGTGGYHAYRIPALVVSTKGTVLAFCEGRKNGLADDGDIDLLLRRSLDGGQTWQDVQLIHDAGANTAGNPAPVVDATTGTIHLVFCINNTTVWVTESVDDGETWATPREITQSVKQPSWTWYATGPGHGIQLQSGRLLIPCDHTGHAHVIYSDDHGHTWQLGGIVTKGTNESIAVETVDGGLYINCRNTSDTGRTHRAYAWSYDGGETFEPAQWDSTLVEPICQASLVRFSTEKDSGRNRVLFCNPASPKRERMTVRVSYDECRTWSLGRIVHFGPSAYSDLCVLPDMTIGLLYEQGQYSPYETITFAQFSLEWLTDGKDRL